MWQKFKNDPVCFGARDNQYGAFIVTKSGLVKAMKFVHRNGSIQCNPIDPPTFWSCSYVNEYPNNSFMTIITNSNRKAFLPSQEKLQLGQYSKKYYYCRLQATKQQFERTLLCIVEQAFRYWRNSSDRTVIKREWFN